MSHLRLQAFVLGPMCAVLVMSSDTVRLAAPQPLQFTGARLHGMLFFCELCWACRLVKSHHVKGSRRSVFRLERESGRCRSALPQHSPFQVAGAAGAALEA